MVKTEVPKVNIRTKMERDAHRELRARAIRAGVPFLEYVARLLERAAREPESLEVGRQGRG